MPLDNPVAAVTHPDPYPYYARLVADQPLYYDAGLACWVASSAAAVTLVLSDPNCKVRPGSEPVPATLLESPAGVLFRSLVRMNDGDVHDRLKQAILAALATIGDGTVEAACQRWAAMLLSRREEPTALGQTAAFSLAFPTHVVGSLLGVPKTGLDRTVWWLDDFVGCLAPGCKPEALERGKLAAIELASLIRTAVTDPEVLARHPVLGSLAQDLNGSTGEPLDLVTANGVGLLVQAYEATAGLIGNVLLALANRPELREYVAADHGLLTCLVREVLRYDAPIQNTRRFVVVDAVIAGQPMRRGEMVLVVLAAANRDPSVHPHPQRLDLQRPSRRVFAFGAGSHACPGAALATTIAVIGIAEILASGLAIADTAGDVTFRPSANARVPMLSLTTPLVNDRGA